MNSSVFYCLILRFRGAVALTVPQNCHEITVLLPNQWPASVAQLDARLTGDQEVAGSTPRRGRQHSFVEIGHEIFSTVFLSLLLIQEGQLSVSGERMCTILVNRLED